MRFLVDECTGPAVARYLQDRGHDVVSMYDVDRGADDPDVLARAVAENRILVTNDKDFGDLVFRDGRAHAGIILLRLGDDRPHVKIDVLTRVLATTDQLEGRFIVATDDHTRIAGPPTH